MKRIISNPVFFFPLAALILGLVLTSIVPPMPVISDSADYDNIALGILETGVYPTISEQEIIYPPLYPLFLSAVYSIFGHSYLAVYLIQFIFLGFIAVFLYRLANKFFGLGRRNSILLGFAVILWPYFLLYSMLISSEILFSLFLLASTLSFFHWWQNPNLKHSSFLAIFLALACLTRPVSLLLPFWIFIGLIILKAIFKFQADVRHLKQGLIVLIFFLILLLPWMGYVATVHDRFIPVASNLSFVFDKANQGLGYLEARADIPLWRAKLLNLALFWNPGASGYHVDLLKENIPLAKYGIALYKMVFILMLLLAALSLRWLKKSQSILFTAVIVAYFWALHTALFPFPRYTLPIIPLVLLLATFGLKELIRKNEKTT